MYNKKKKKLNWKRFPEWTSKHEKSKNAQEKKLSKQVAIKASLRKIRARGEPGATKRVKMEDHHICIHFLIFVHTASLWYLFLPLSSEQRNLGQRDQKSFQRIAHSRDTRKAAMLRPRWSIPAHHGVPSFLQTHLPVCSWTTGLL